MNGALNVIFFLALPKRSNIILFQLHSQFQRFLFQTLCVFSQMKDAKHIRWFFSFCRLGYALGSGLGELRGQNQIPTCRLSVMLSHMNGTCTIFFLLTPPPGALGRGQKVKYHLISITKSISKIFIPNFVCVLTNDRYKTF